jgi:hypothetical protein
MLDHVSASWGTDETLSSSPNWRRGDDLGDVTVQWSIISESLCKIVGPTHFRHCFGSLVGEGMGGRTTYHHDLWAHHGGRMPRPNNKFPPSQDPQGGLLDFRSNVFYNWGGPQVGYNSGPPGKIAYNFVNNSYVPGPDSKGRLIFDERDPFASAWFSGNTFNGAIMADRWGQIAGADRPGFRLSGPIPMPPVTTDSASTAYQEVLAYAGDSVNRDSVDSRVLASVKNRGGRLIDSQDDVGGWPDLARGKPWADSDGDGIPDDWERSHGLNPRDARDGARVTSDGYTNLEHWLNELAAPAMPR